MATSKERRHLARIAALGCICCRMLGHGETPAQVHHLREGQGMATRSSHWLTIPLCHDHHTGKDGIHGTKAVMRLLKADELELLAATLEALSA